MPFGLVIDRARRLVEKDEMRAVDGHWREGEPLLRAEGEDRAPVPHRIQASRPACELGQAHRVKRGFEAFVIR